jgi:predicted AAA+ superfamily ATPase
MRPLSLSERGIDEPIVSLKSLLAGEEAPLQGNTNTGLRQYVGEIFASGYPAIRTLPTDLRGDVLDSYLTYAVEQEFAEQGIRVRRPQTLMAWLRAFAAATATPSSYGKILNAATAGVSDKPSRETTTLYRDVLARGFFLDSVQAWTPAFNPLKRLAGSPKHYLADPALAARLLDLTPQAVLTGADQARPSLRAGSMLGPLFEHLVAQSVLVYAEAAGAQVGHLRQNDGRREIDLIVEKGQAVVAIEVKLATTVTDQDVKHLVWLRQQLGQNLVNAAVITTGQVAYRRPDGINVVPAALLGP